MSNSSITVRKNGKLGMDKEDEKDHQAIQIQNMLFFHRKRHLGMDKNTTRTVQVCFGYCKQNMMVLFTRYKRYVKYKIPKVDFQNNDFSVTLNVKTNFDEVRREINRKVG